jgi:hypothetical protein
LPAWSCVLVPSMLEFQVGQSCRGFFCYQQPLSSRRSSKPQRRPLLTGAREMENVFFHLASASVTVPVAFVLTFNNGSDAGESILGPAVINTTI